MVIVAKKINPLEHPIHEGENWWIVHPNNGNCVFSAPPGAITVCLVSFNDTFYAGKVYTIVSNNEHSGWISVQSASQVVEMPYYVFARYFDAEAFVRGTFDINEGSATAFDYKPTVPAPPKQHVNLFDQLDTVGSPDKDKDGK